MVMVDSSVWIDFLKGRETDLTGTLEDWIEEECKRRLKSAAEGSPKVRHLWPEDLTPADPFD